MIHPTSCDSYERVNIPLRRLPKIRCGVTLIWIELSQSLQSSDNDERSNCFTFVQNNCNTIRYTNMSKAIKYVKQARSYEHIIVAIVLNAFDKINNEISIHDLNRINQYPQVQSIIIICQNNEMNSNEKIHDFQNIIKLIGIYDNYRSASVTLKTLLDDADEFDGDFLATFNKKEKSLRDVRQDLIAFLSTHSYRG